MKTEENKTVELSESEQSTKRLLESFIQVLGTAEIITMQGLNFETLKKDNLIATALVEKDKILDTMNVNAMSRMTINGVVKTMLSVVNTGKPINLELGSLVKALEVFFTENAHLVEGLPELVETVKQQIAERKAAKA